MEPSAPRRSFVARELLRVGARLVQHGDATVARDFGDEPRELARARQAAIADLSSWPRGGFKGKDTIDWLARQGVTAAPEPNRVFAQADGSMVAMLSWSEALILHHPITGNGPAARLQAAWSLDGSSGCYALPRRDSHYWFTITGAQSPQMLAKLCAIDLRPRHFLNGSIAQTSVAQSTAIVIRADLGATLAYHLLGDSASAQYMWETLLDALGEFDGGAIGHAALSALQAEVDVR